MLGKGASLSGDCFPSCRFDFCHVILVSIEIESLTKTKTRAIDFSQGIRLLFISILSSDTDVDEVEIVLCIAESFVRVNYNGKERRLQRVESERSSGQMCGELCGSRCLDESVFVLSYHIKKERSADFSRPLFFFCSRSVRRGRSYV